MKATVYFDDFEKAFERQERKDNFSHEGLEYLYKYLTETEEGTEQELELDVISLCCEFGEDTIENFRNDHDINLQEIEEHEAVINTYSDMVLYHAWYK